MGPPCLGPARGGHPQPGTAGNGDKWWSRGAPFEVRGWEGAQTPLTVQVWRRSCQEAAAASSSSGTDGCQHGGGSAPHFVPGTGWDSSAPLQSGTEKGGASGIAQPNKGAAPTTTPKKPLLHLGAPHAPATTTSHLHPNLFFRPEAALSGGGDVPSPVPAMVGVAQSWGGSAGGATGAAAPQLWGWHSPASAAHVEKGVWGGTFSALAWGARGGHGSRAGWRWSCWPCCCVSGDISQRWAPADPR